MSIIDEFLSRYNREFDFFHESARICAEQCENLLSTSGIRAIVTYRAKRADRLKDKLRKRNELRHYQDVNSIYEDLVDLAGVRIALYFPGKLNEVETLISSNFKVVKKKAFPEPSQGEQPKESGEKYQKIFSGYSARHFRVNLNLPNTHPHYRYNLAHIEIQVASVLIHAWSEVEHDLVYKPLSGQLTEDEYAILDELNGLVLAGEIALNRLDRAGQQLFNKDEEQFRNHYVLSSYIYEKVKNSQQEPVMGRMDILFKFLQIIKKDMPKDIKFYLEEIKFDDENRPIAEQIIDKIIAGDKDLYNEYEKVRYSLDKNNNDKNDEMHNTDQKLGKFIRYWTIFEGLIRSISPFETSKKSLSFILNNIEWIEDYFKKDILSIVPVRNHVVHGTQDYLYFDITNITDSIPSIIERLRDMAPETIKPSFDQALKAIRSKEK